MSYSGHFARIQPEFVNLFHACWHIDNRDDYFRGTGWEMSRSEPEACRGTECTPQKIQLKRY